MIKICYRKWISFYYLLFISYNVTLCDIFKYKKVQQNLIDKLQHYIKWGNSISQQLIIKLKTVITQNKWLYNINVDVKFIWRYNNLLVRTRVYMCLLSQYPLPIINVAYGFGFALDDQLSQEKSKNDKTSITNTNNLSGVERDCGGGGRKYSRRCTTAAIILIFETITNNFMTHSKKKCDVIITIQLQRDNPKLNVTTSD